MTTPSVAVARRKPSRFSDEPFGSRSAKFSSARGASGSASALSGELAISATSMMDRTLWNAH
jgi:hypothetical protein